MKTCGIIAEYNPFHQGHRYQLQQAKIATQADAIAVILSGPFSQRGLPSLMDPYTKTKLALEYGADLVLELPTCYAVQSAEFFAKYAIQSLASLPIDHLCFGSETNDIRSLTDYARSMDSIEIDPTKSINLNTQHSWQANDILGIHYVKECLDTTIEPISIARNNAYKSATQTRHDFFEGEPQDFDSLFHKEQRWESYYPYLRSFLLMSSPVTLQSFFLVNEGIEYRLTQAAKEHTDWNGFLDACISKTYSKSRIRRTCVMVMLQITKEEMAANDSFHQLKVLGFNEVGKSLLKETKAPVLTKFKDCSPFLQQILTKSWDLYNSVMETPISGQAVIQVD